MEKVLKSDMRGECLLQIQIFLGLGIKWRRVDWLANYPVVFRKKNFFFFYLLCLFVPSKLLLNNRGVRPASTYLV